ncbi:hypothetical protein ACFQL1_16110 [Halomicroarcula sp. GCM10025709]|uniref:hypothetical protein n=1 Tax=Haloarcula TaxID=2237 RepID=UPI0024C2C024|nr:hypothetical protein [Halomicroarcula sp. YJ-61-S]
MPDGAHDKVKLNVRVPPNKKQEWKDSLEEGETLSSLVRRAVDHEIRDEYVSKGAIDELVTPTDQSDIDLSSLTDRLEEMQQTVEAFESKLDTLSASSTEEADGDIENLAMDLLPRIPTYPQDIPEHVLRSVEGTGDMDPKEYISYIIPASRKDEDFPLIEGTAQRLAREMREPTPKVREALIYLETDTTENVESAIVDGVRHWMKGL